MTRILSAPARSTWGALAAATTLVAAGLVFAGSAQAAPQTFTSTGAEQTYVVPAGITTVTVTATGAPGAPHQYGTEGGLGRVVTAELPVTPGQTLYVEVGGAGSGTNGGFNGGGDGGIHGQLGGLLGGGGGGATDVRTCPRSGPCPSGATLDSRLLVAGGGGGGGIFAGGNAGSDGTPSIYFPDSAGKAGTLGAGGAGGGAGNEGADGSPGQYGVGGTGADGVGPGTPGGGGGGGGYFGGGGSGSGGASGGGGGGSSFIQAGATNVSQSTGTSTPSVTITPNTGPVVDTQPTDTAVAAGSTATFTAAASGFPNPTVQWEVSTGGGWNDVAGATSDTLTLAGTTVGMDGNQYRAVYSNVFGGSPHTVTTSAATLTVNFGPTITTQPVDDAVTSGDTATFTAAASGNPGATVQWQISTLGTGPWTDVAAAITGTLTVTGTTPGMNGNKYRAVFTSTYGGTDHSATSDAATLTVNSPPVLVDVTPTPAAVGTPYSYTFTATGFPAPTFSVGSGTLPAGLSLDPIFGVLSGTPTTAGSYTFTVVASNGIGANATTDPITMTIGSAVDIDTGALPDGTVGVEYSATLTTSGGGSAPDVWSLAAGSELPDGLTLSADGLVSGTPTTAGTTTFKVSVIDPAVRIARPGAGPVLAELSITINPADNPAGPGTLPATGASTNLLGSAQLALGLLVAGLLLLVASRRIRH